MDGWGCSARILILSAIVAASTSASAGELGSTSRGSIAIAVTIPTRLEAKALQDREVAQALPRGWDSQALCVVTNSHGTTYSITLVAASDDTDSGSALRSGYSDTLSVDWSDESHGFQSAKLRPAQPIGGFPAADAANCLPSADGTAKITIKATERVRLALNSFREPVTLLIGPE